MSGFASREVFKETEAAGKVGQWLGVVAAIFVPYAAPALFSSIASSGVLGAGLAQAATTGTLSALTNTLGSAVVGGLMNAGVAYASGARGGAVWQAAGMGALQGGMGGLSRAGGAAANAATSAATSSVGGGVSGAMQGIGAATGNLAGAGLNTATSALGGMTAAGGAGLSGIASGALQQGTSGGVMGTIQRMFGGMGAEQVRRMGAVVVNAAVNGTQLAGMDDIVAQQRAELAALAQTNQAAYQQRISEAQKILASADAMDPAWRGRVAMADVQGAESHAADQAMRNIAVRQGGSLDSGQRKAYERGSALHTARSKALAYNQGFKQAETAQAQMRATGAGLLGPDAFGLQLQQAGQGLAVDAHRARGELLADTAGAFSSAVFGRQYNPATSPDSTSDYNDEDQFTFGSFGNGGG